MTKKKIDVSDVDAILEDAIANVHRDRAKADILLLDLINYLKESVDRNEKVGSVAAKYLETLQRSNEQLVKIAELARKRVVTTGSVKLSDEDKESIFDEIIKENETETEEED